MGARILPVWLWAVLLLFCGRAAAIEATEYVISRDQWPEHVHSSNIAALPQLRQVLAKFDESGRYRLVVRYPGGESGADWAQQLVHWFVAYGVPGEFIGRELGSGGPDRLLLLLIEN
jgi:hypothetical protein